MTRKAKKPTWTLLVTQALKNADDFLNAAQLREATGANMDQLSATLYHLQKAKAVDSVESNGKPYWFLTGADTRSHQVEERTPEEPGTRHRRSKV